MSNVLVQQDEKTFFDLAGDELYFPMDDVEGYVAHFCCDAQVGSNEIREASDALSGHRRDNQDNETEVVPGDSSVAQEFISRHFRGVIAGVEGEPDPDVVKRWLDERPGLKLQLYTEGYRNILPIEKPEAGRLRIMLADEPEVRVETIRPLYCPERERVVRVSINHVFRALTEGERQRRAKVLRMFTKKNRTYFRTNWDLIEETYLLAIQRVEGMLIDGEPCGPENKNRWVPKVWLFDKAHAVGHLLDKVQAKN